MIYTAYLLIIIIATSVFWALSYKFGRDYGHDKAGSFEELGPWQKNVASLKVNLGCYLLLGFIV